MAPVAAGPAIPAGLESSAQTLGALHRLQHIGANNPLPRDYPVAHLQQDVSVCRLQDDGDRRRVGAAEVPQRRWFDEVVCRLKRTSRKCEMSHTRGSAELRCDPRCRTHRSRSIGANRVEPGETPYFS